MRTTLDIDDWLMDALLERNPRATKTEVVERALKAYLEEDAIQRLIRAAGSFEVDDVSGELRGVDRHT
jgi:Arc/MetJ family transcription regulator